MKLIIFALLILGMTLARPRGMRWPGLYLDTRGGNTVQCGEYIQCQDGWAWGGCECKKCEKNTDSCCFQSEQILEAMNQTMHRGCKHILFSFIKSI